jgi:hypothetical protein
MVKPVDPTQGAFNFGENPEKPEKRKVGPSAFDEELRKQEDARKEDKQEKAKAKAAENAEYADKRQPKSELIRQAEIAKMKEILDKPKVGSGSGSMGTGKMNRDISKNMKAGGKVKSASSRADGCAIRGKTRA